jgi:CBS domain-containing protein
MGTQDRRVGDVMHTEVVSLGQGDRLDIAEDIMRLGRIRHMPVLDGDRVVGIVSSRDLLAASLSKVLDFDPQHRRAFLRSVDVSEVMTRDLVTVEPEATLREAADLIVRRKIGCLPVVKPDGTFLGVVTETDLIRAALLREGPEIDPRLATKENGMSELGQKIDEELDALRRIRDELRLQMRLAQSEGKDLWDELERKYQELEGKAKLVGRQAEQPLQEVGEAARILLAEIREGYRKLRAAL